MPDGQPDRDLHTPLRPHLDAGLSRKQLFSYARDLRSALDESRRTTEELERTHLETVAALAAAVDARDSITGGHVHRVANYGVILAQAVAPELRHDPQLVYGFLLHDIGKIATPDAILNKPGALEPDEAEVMRRHVPDGVRFVGSVGFLRPALDIVGTHHEHVDGSGYPRGLHGDEIPIGARMFIVCDAFDAMTHDRPYRDGMGPDQAMAELRRGRGTQFDGDVLDAFEQLLDEVLAVPVRPTVPPVRPRAPRRRARTDVALRAAVFDALEEPVAVLAPGGAVEESNEAFRRLLGLEQTPVGVPISEVVRRATGSLLETEGAAAAIRPLERDLLDGQRRGTLRTIDGQVLSWSSRLLRDGQGGVLGRMLAVNAAAADLGERP